MGWWLVGGRVVCDALEHEFQTSRRFGRCGRVPRAVRPKSPLWAAHGQRMGSVVVGYVIAGVGNERMRWRGRRGTHRSFECKFGDESAKSKPRADFFAINRRGGRGGGNSRLSRYGVHWFDKPREPQRQSSVFPPLPVICTSYSSKMSSPFRVVFLRLFIGDRGSGRKMLPNSLS